MRLALFAAILICTESNILAQSDRRTIPASETKADWKPTHPNGDNPHERMLVLVHTDALPRFDRAELFAISFPDRKGNEKPKDKPTDKTFPVSPYGLHADIHDQITIEGGDCDKLRTAWQSLSIALAAHFATFQFMDCDYTGKKTGSSGKCVRRV